MVESMNEGLLFRFPDVHPEAVCHVDFQRTLRIPDDNRQYPLPPGLGRFPLEHVEDHASRLPAGWTQHGGVLLPMYQAEALWINFASGPTSRRGARYPFAVKVAAGKINAITGEAWSNGLASDPQDYLVVPEQPWLDGFCVKKGMIRQFVAMPLGRGYTAEEQISGEAEHGGLQIVVFPMKPDRYEAMLNRQARRFESGILFSLESRSASASMGLAPGGLMRQEIYEDEHGLDAWDLHTSSRCFVHILNSSQWQVATGRPVPGEPPSAANYTKAGLPWFEYYDDRLNALNGASKLAGLNSVAAQSVKLGDPSLPGNEGIEPPNIIPLSSKSAKISDGAW